MGYALLFLNFARSQRLLGWTDMIVEFTKMNGAGNDFVLIDNRERKIKLS